MVDVANTVRKRNLLGVTSETKVVFKVLVLAQTSRAENFTVFSRDIRVMRGYAASALIILVTLRQGRKRLRKIQDRKYIRESKAKEEQSIHTQREKAG